MSLGINQDDQICPFPNTRTLKCLNPFCGFTWGENMDEVKSRVIEDISECPKCHGTEFNVINYNFKGFNK